MEVEASITAYQIITLAVGAFTSIISVTATGVIIYMKIKNRVTKNEEKIEENEKSIKENTNAIKGLDDKIDANVKSFEKCVDALKETLLRRITESEQKRSEESRASHEKIEGKIETMSTSMNEVKLDLQALISERKGYKAAMEVVENKSK